MTETSMLPFLFNEAERDFRPQLQNAAPAPMSPGEVAERGWEDVDVVFITGDAYVDSPSFANGLLARVLEADGFRVAVLSQPNWRSADDFRKFGRPRLAFCVSAGNMDTMINLYTANLKVRNSDAYSPGGKIGNRPDRATLAYSQRAREAFPDVPIIVGGVEASLRRIAHYDYKSNKVRRSIALDAKADLLIYGMGERPLLEILRRLAKGESIETIRDVRGTVYRLGKTEDLPEESETVAHLPSFDEVEENERLAKLRFVKMTQLAYENLNPYRAKTLVQEHGEEAVVVNPPSFPLTQEEMDFIYALPFTRKPHPSYTEPIPAADVVKASIQTHRGCFGGCSFCAITAHQGKFIQTRSENAIIEEIGRLAKQSGGSYVVSDMSAPTANMYGMRGKNPEACKKCARTSCLCPEQCPNLDVNCDAYISLLKKAREIDGVKKVFIASGVRTDLAIQSPRFIDELAAEHTGGHLKTAPEHTDDDVLRLMNKPPIENYELFCEMFATASEKAGKEQYLVPYLIAGYPGCSLRQMVSVAEYLKARGIKPEQVQEFIPAPFQLATCAYYTGIDPLSEENIYVPRGQRERRLQKALLLYYDLNNYHDVKSALKEAGREDLIGNDENSLIPPYPSKGAALRQSSRVKRLIRKTERENEEKAKRREQFELQQEREKGRGKRQGRDLSGRGNGGYRAAAREYARGTDRPRYQEKKTWDPIDKKWERTLVPEQDSFDADFRRETRERQDRRERPRDERQDRPRRSRDGYNGRDGATFERDAQEFTSFKRRDKNEGEEFRKDDARSSFKRSYKNERTQDDGENVSRSPKRFARNDDAFSSRAPKRERRFNDNESRYRSDDSSIERSERSNGTKTFGNERGRGGASRSNYRGRSNDNKRKGARNFGPNKKGAGFKRRGS